MEVVRKKISELHEAKINSRYHSDRQIDEYIRSVKMFGQTKPIVADENGEVIIGNGLLKAMQKMGASEADCYIVTGLTEAQKKKMMLSDNKIFELGMSLDEVMQDIVKEYKDVDIPGFNEDVLSAIVASSAETTQVIENYGSYSSQALQSIEKNAADENRPPLYTDAPAFQPKNEPPAETSTADAAETKPMGSESVQTDEGGNFIICPHCGLRITI